MNTKIRIKDSHQTMKIIYKDRIFKTEVWGTGNNCSVEIDEVSSIGGSMGFRKSYKVPFRIKWKLILERYMDDTKNRMQN